jgi:hypothetical protein
MKKQHEDGNFYGIPLEEKVSGEEARQSFDDLCRAALLLPNREWIATQRHFVQDIGATQSPDWKISWKTGG